MADRAMLRLVLYIHMRASCPKDGIYQSLFPQLSDALALNELSNAPMVAYEV